MRWVFCRHNPVQNLNFGYALGDDVRRKFLTLWNVYSFFVTYANIDGWAPAQDSGLRGLNPSPRHPAPSPFPCSTAGSSRASTRW